MKIWAASALLLAVGCASTPVPAAAPPASTSDGREFVDRLRVESAWHPAPTGGDCISVGFELPPGSYVAQGWGAYDFCYRDRPIHWSRTSMSQGCSWSPACYSERPICWSRREFIPRR